jgi:hypothetical protein
MERSAAFPNVIPIAGRFSHQSTPLRLVDLRDATAARPDTILGWYRKLIANKFDGSKARRTQDRPRIDEEIESLVVRMAKENPS